MEDEQQMTGVSEKADVERFEAAEAVQADKDRQVREEADRLKREADETAARERKEAEEADRLKREAEAAAEQ